MSGPQVSPHIPGKYFSKIFLAFSGFDNHEMQLNLHCISLSNFSVNSNPFDFRFAKNKLVSSENYVTVMIRLHLAHERFHSIDTKMKGNPLSL